MTAAGKARGIIFRSDMVRAILDGRKTQTRRVVKNDGKWEMDELDDGTPWPRYASYVDVEPECAPVPCPYGVPGDRLFVREAMHHADNEGGLTYAADGSPVIRPDGIAPIAVGRIVVVPVFMPRWASRLTLVVEAVRVERLSAITEDDAIAEGATFDGVRWTLGDGRASHARLAYVSGFRAMHKLDADADPWLWVVTFRKETSNG